MLSAFDTLASRAAAIGVALDIGQIDLLRRHFALLMEANRVMNLTRVMVPEEAVQKLYFASLALFPVLRECEVEVAELAFYADLGTGAGFPGIPIAVAAPHLHTVLIDSRGKKVGFCESSAAELGLTNVSAVKARGREIPGTHKGLAGLFNIVTARAMASAARCVEEAHTLLAPGGLLVVWKGPSLTDEEIAAGEAAAREFGLKPRGLHRPALEGLDPRLLVYEKPR